ncbi:uroporphyrinogen-III synthase [Rhodobacteraceae bacterium 63075]|nr:uroporphyrinogen-III synthase [Rhodobacteraceae bacterium 63075]
MGKTSSPVILLTRPREAAERFAAALARRLGNVPIILSPVLEIEYLSPEAIPQASALVFTSSHGVEGYRRAHGPVGRAYCVGERTAETALKTGHQIINVTPDAARLETVLSGVGERLLHVRGRHVAAQLADGHDNIDELIVYDQHTTPLTDEARSVLEGERSVVLPLFSPRSASELARQISGNTPRFAAFMSPAVRDAFGPVPLRESILAQTPDAEAMLESTAALYDAASALERRSRGA